MSEQIPPRHFTLLKEIALLSLRHGPIQLQDVCNRRAFEVLGVHFTFSVSLVDEDTVD